MNAVRFQNFIGERFRKMKYHDITRELISAPLYPEAPQPQLEQLAKISEGAPYNFSILHANLHAGTHIDAYHHFCDGECDAAEMPLEHFIGPCYVLSVPEKSLVEAGYFKENLPAGVKRVLIKSGGESYLAPDAGAYLIEQGLITVGSDAWSVAPAEDEASIHVPFLCNKVAIIESLDLSGVEDGEYFLVAAPVKIKGAEGASCRALLFEGSPVE